jgi:thioredoxin-like negative regulator of GroEL
MSDIPVNAPKSLQIETDSNSLTKSTFYIGLFISVAIVVVAVYFLNTYGYKLNGKKEVKNNNEFNLEEHIEVSPFVQDVKSDLEAINALNGNGKSKVVLIHAPWCGHCRNMMSEFIAASALERTVEWIRVDSKVSPTVSRRSDLRGFPTIYGVSPDGVISQHNGSRDKKTLIEFAKKISESVPILRTDQGNVKAVSFQEQ